MGENSHGSGPIRVLLADDHTMFRQDWPASSPPTGGMEAVAEVPNDADALEIARAALPRRGHHAGSVALL